MYNQYRMRRVYYSAFSPIPQADARLPVQAPPLVREHRLYQADWLMRFYGFDVQELTTPQEPNLDLKIDPKLAWALRHRESFPIDINRASRSQLLRIPGIGVRNVDRILDIRRYHQLRLADLAKLRVSLKKVKPFVLTADYNPDALRIDRQDLRQRVVRPYQQLELFAAAQSATTGEV
jgi:predicted DNA-binding helix-hairpin-helix protein